MPLILAGLLWWFDRWQTKRGKRPEKRLPVNFKWLYLLGLIGCLTHPALDWLNVYGIRLLEPISSQWFYGDTLFIIDVWLWGLLIGAVWWGARREKSGGDQRPIARGAIALMLAYIGVNGAITHLNDRWDNLDPYGEVHTFIASPVPFKFWKREQIQSWDGETWYIFHAPYVGSRDKTYMKLPPPDRQCRLPDLTTERQSNSQLDAFLFWSRAPFAERAEDGSVILRDARFYDPRARDRFSIALPDVECEEL